MKNHLPILLIFLFFSTHIKAQCSSPNFLATVGYAQYRGVGAEVGYWPQEFRLGGFIGFGMQWPGKTVKHPDQLPVSSVYLKAQFRHNRYLYIIGIAGAHQFDEGYLSGGIRFAIPLAGHDDNFRWALVGETTVGTEGPNVNIGIGYSL